MSESANDILCPRFRAPWFRTNTVYPLRLESWSTHLRLAYQGQYHLAGPGAAWVQPLRSHEAGEQDITPGDILDDPLADVVHADAEHERGHVLGGLRFQSDFEKTKK